MRMEIIKGKIEYSIKEIEEIVELLEKYSKDPTLPRTKKFLEEWKEILKQKKNKSLLRFV